MSAVPRNVGHEERATNGRDLLLAGLKIPRTLSQTVATAMPPTHTLPSSGTSMDPSTYHVVTPGVWIGPRGDEDFHWEHQI